LAGLAFFAGALTVLCAGAFAIAFFAGADFAGAGFAVTGFT
jgi:hypothetical protein